MVETVKHGFDRSVVTRALPNRESYPNAARTHRRHRFHRPAPAAGMPKHGHRLRVLPRRPLDVPVEAASAVIGDLARPRNMAARTPSP